MTKEPFATRLARFRNLMRQREFDAFLVASPENRYYLSGYGEEDLQLTESSGYLLIAESKQLLLTDFRYQEAAKQQAPDFDLVIYKEGLKQALPDLFSTIGVERLGTEGDYLIHRKFVEIEETLLAARPGASVTPLDGFVDQMRIIKEPEEIQRIKSSLRLTESALSSVWSNLEPGRKERELAWAIERFIREAGAEAVSFPPIVAGGPNAALPHAVPGDREIAPGDSVILDLGSKLDRYCSDMTRTWVAGKPEQKLREIYKIVREAQLAAQDAIRAGKSTVEIDGIAREIIERAGYGDCFGHGLGHGVGLAVHEKPSLRKQGATILQENMVVTVEPGIYLPGYGGVRLENMVRITQTGCEVLNELDLFYPWEH